ncbi:MAG: glycosyltransferase [Patescibacteria group bacterium]|jgi:glycosyltransferase involved in cell wall biosynthesis
MKIVLVVHGFPPYSLAGVELYTYALAKELAKKHEVFVFTRLSDRSKEDYSIIQENRNGLKITQIVNNLLPPLSFVGSYQNAEIDKVFSRYLDEVKPDVVHFQHCYLLSANLISIAHQAGYPTVLTLHDYWYACPSITMLSADGKLCSQNAGLDCLKCFYSQHPPEAAPTNLPIPQIIKKITPVLLKQNIKRLISVLNGANRRNLQEGKWFIQERQQFMKEMLSQVDQILTPSDFMKKKYASLGLIKVDAIKLVPYGIITDEYAGISKIESPRVRFGFFGSVLKHKGLHLLIKAFNELPRETAELHIHGDYSFDPVYYRQCKKISKHPFIFFHGAYSPKDLANIFKSIDTTVISSICWETGPLTLLESLASKTPAIVPDTSGPREIIEKYRGGLMYAFRDVDSLRQRLQEIIKNPDKINDLTLSIRPVRNQTDQAQEIIEIYEKINHPGEL